MTALFLSIMPKQPKEMSNTISLRRIFIPAFRINASAVITSLSAAAAVVSIAATAAGAEITAAIAGTLALMGVYTLERKGGDR